MKRILIALALVFGVAGCQLVIDPVNPSGVILPIGNIPASGSEPAWNQVFADSFLVNAPLGSFATQSSDTVVYTGDHGGQWYAYPDGWPSTNTGTLPGYQPGQVLSVHDGYLDYYLHNVLPGDGVGTTDCPSSGCPSGANLSPVLSSEGGDQLYGRYSINMRAVGTNMDDYHIALLLWPENGDRYEYDESDFPELTLGAPLTDTTVCAYAHYGGAGDQDAFCANNVDVTQWHTYTQEWFPGVREYFIDGNLIGISTHQVDSADPEHWQLQIEPSGSNDGDSGDVEVDWVAVYSYGAT